MTSLSRHLLTSWVRLGPRFLPFADAASPGLPLSRLLRLSLFQVSVGMALVLMLGTLNRVMIVELGVPASLVALVIALPVIYAPMRALIGFKSDHHRSALGWRRVPYMWMGTMIQFGGLALANDQAAPDRQPRVVGLMYVMLLLGTMGSALLFGWLLRDFSPGRLVQVIQGAAVATLVLNAVALWQQETRDPQRVARSVPA